MEGWECEGVDASTEMLEICRKKFDDDNLPVRLLKQRFERLNLGTRFDRIIISGLPFQHLIEIPVALPRIRDHLKTHGRLIISLFHPWESLRSSGNQTWKLRSSTSLEDGNRVLVHESVTA